MHRYRVRSSTPYLLRRPRNPICQEITHQPPIQPILIGHWQKNVSKYGYITLTQSNWVWNVFSRGDVYRRSSPSWRYLCMGVGSSQSPSHPSLYTQEHVYSVLFFPYLLNSQKWFNKWAGWGHTHATVCVVLCCVSFTPHAMTCHALTNPLQDPCSPNRPHTVHNPHRISCPV